MTSGGQNSSNASAACPTVIHFQTVLEYGVDSSKQAYLYGAAACTALTYIVYIYATVSILDKYASLTRRSDALIVLSVYPVISTVSLLAVFLPRSAVLCDAISSVYLSIVVWRFGNSIPRYFGGREQMVRELSNHDVSFRTPPCCCCCFCLQTKKFSRSILFWIRASITQFIIVRPIVMSLAAILWADDLYDTGAINPRGSYLYINIVNVVSTLFAMYGLALMLNASRKYLATTLVVGKFLLLQMVIVLTSLQNLIFTALSTTGVIGCTAYLPASAHSNEYQHVALIFELFAVSAAAAAVYGKAFERERQFFILTSANTITRELSAGNNQRSRTLTNDSSDSQPSYQSQGVILAINSLA